MKEYEGKVATKERSVVVVVFIQDNNSMSYYENVSLCRLYLRLFATKAACLRISRITNYSCNPDSALNGLKQQMT